MSSPIHQSDDLDPALRYAPRWARERASLAGRPVPAPPPLRPLQPARPDFSGDRAVIELQRQLLLDPDAIPEPVVDDARALKPIVLRLSGVMGIAALIAWGVVSFPGVKKASEILSADVRTPAITGNSLAPVLPQAAIAAPPPSTLQRAVATAQSGQSVVAMNDPATPAAPNPPNALRASVATVGPLPAMMQPASVPPVSVPPQPQAPASASPAATPPPAAATPRIDDTEIVAMIKRGKDLLMSGDIVSARLLLRRAADAGNAEAALTLGATFDPLFIRRLGAVGMMPDIAQARQWYQRAAALGSASATEQLAKLEQAQ